MPKLKSERHHWWPRCVSARWADEDGKTGWIRPDGTSIRVPPKKLGLIGNGHHIKLSSCIGGSSPWDTSFEDEFDTADSNFPAIISWLESLQHEFILHQNLCDRFLPQPASVKQLRMLTECVVSLAVRSPMNREALVSPAEHLRGGIPNPERNALIGANMQHSQRLIADSIGANGKFAILFSQRKEFIFGDGFFHNVKGVRNPPIDPKILAPITPNMSVIVTRPTYFIVQPRLSTIVLSDEEVDRCNHAIQVYSHQALYFRNHPPTIGDAFTSNEHRVYSHPDNPIDDLLCSIPGIPARDKSLDFLMGKGQ
ncbi:hypothetical protein ACTVJH_14225 [Desulfoplanes sp. PS50]